MTGTHWLGPVNTAAERRGHRDISSASSIAIWLDTVTHIDVARLPPQGQAMLGGTKTSEDVVRTSR
jgi:hypothetical protein